MRSWEVLHCILFCVNQAVFRALYAVLSHDISSRICDVALNIIDCLLQLGVVPDMGKKMSKSENKENQEARAKESVVQGLGGGAQGGGPIAGAGGGGDGGGGGSGGGSGQGSKDDVKNNKDNDKKVCFSHLYMRTGECDITHGKRLPTK